MGLALSAKGDRDGAIVEFRTAIRIDPEFAPAHYHLGVALGNKRKLDEAIAECREAIRLDPNDPDAHNNLGTILCDVKRDYDAAIACFKEAIRIKKDATSHCNLGNALVGKGDWNAAIAEFREAIRLDPNDADAHTNLGAILCDLKRDYDAAVACFREAIRIKEDDVEAHNNLGVALRGKGDTDGAINEFQKAIRLNPRFALAHDNLGNALAATGDLDRAVVEFREAARLGLRAPGLQARILKTERWRELTPRLKDTAVGRGGPNSPAEGCELAELASRPFQRRYLLAVRLYQLAFATNPKFAAMHSYNAACAAAQAAGGTDVTLRAFSVDEWGYLTGLAHGWLRTDLAAWASRAADPKQGPTTRQALTYWKRDPDLIAVRDPVRLAAMLDVDKKRWQSLWADVDALLAKVSQSEKSGK